MGRTSQRITVSGLPVEVVRKDIKNLHLGVYPPNGRVRVAVPRQMQGEAIRLVVSTKMGWIKRQQTKFREQARQSPREYIYRETHYFLGRSYLLKVVEQTGPAHVAVRSNTTMELHIPKGADTAKREQVMQAWYRRELKACIPSLIEKWEPIIGVQVRFWGVKKMKTKWGSCNSEAGRIWLNLELAKKPFQCLEYIAVHEMVHLIHRHHDDKFKNLLHQIMPQWQTYRDELNRAPLGHENWSY